MILQNLECRYLRRACIGLRDIYVFSHRTDNITCDRRHLIGTCDRHRGRLRDRVAASVLNVVAVGDLLGRTCRQGCVRCRINTKRIVRVKRNPRSITGRGKSPNRQRIARIRNACSGQEINREDPIRIIGRARNGTRNNRDVISARDRDCCRLRDAAATAIRNIVVVRDIQCLRIVEILVSRGIDAQGVIRIDRHARCIAIRQRQACNTQRIICIHICRSREQVNGEHGIGIIS